jgi:hypothetical protein
MSKAEIEVIARLQTAAGAAECDPSRCQLAQIDPGVIMRLPKFYWFV